MKPMMDLVMGLQTRCEYKGPVSHTEEVKKHRTRQLSTLIVNIETDMQAE